MPLSATGWRVSAPGECGAILSMEIQAMKSKSTTLSFIVSWFSFESRMQRNRPRLPSSVALRKIGMPDRGAKRQRRPRTSTRRGISLSGLYAARGHFSTAAILLLPEIASASVCNNGDASSPCTVEAGGVEFQHDGHTRTPIPREVWKNFADAPKIYQRFPRAVAEQGFRVSDDKQWLFIPHVEDPDASLHAHFVRKNGGSGEDGEVQYGFFNGVFTPGVSSPMLVRNVAQLSYQERVVVSRGGPIVAASETTVAKANATFTDPAVRKASLDPKIRDEQIYATYRFLFGSVNTANRYHTMNNPGLMARLREYSEAEPTDSSTMPDKIAITEHLLRGMRDELDQVDLSVSPTTLLPNTGACNHFTDHQHLQPDDVEATRIKGGSQTRKGGWFKLSQLFVIRKGDSIAAPVPYLSYLSGTQYFFYNEERDTVEAFVIIYGVLRTRLAPPVYTDSPPRPLGQRVEIPPAGQYYREFPVPGYDSVNPDTRVRDNNMWQSEVAKYWYQKMWTYPQDYTYLWPEEVEGKERCSAEYLEKEVLSEMEDWDWVSMVQRVKAPDANVITSERPTGFSNERKTVLRIVRKATNCFTPIISPETRHGYGFSIAVAVGIFHLLDELASTAAGRRAAFSHAFLQRAKFQYRFASQPLVPNAIPELAGVHALATDLKSSHPVYSYRFDIEKTPQALHLRAGARTQHSLRSKSGIAVLLDFKPLEKTPLQVPRHEKKMRNCLLMPDDDIMNLRLAAETKLFPMKRDVYMDSEVLDHMRSLGNLWKNAKDLAQYKDPLPPARITPSGFAETVFKPEELAILYSAEDMIISGVADVLELDADMLQSSIWRKELVYDDWGYRRSAEGRPQVIVYEKETQTEYYPCSTIRKQHVELVSEDWNAVEFEDGVANHVAHITATAATRDQQILAVCQSVQQHCAGDNMQFADVPACQASLASLPTQDATCRSRRRAGSFSVQGNSLTCKWVQSRFLEFSPHDYCASMGASPPAGDRCSASLYSSNADLAFGAGATTRTSTCDAENKSEIIVGTLAALPFCLPTLVGSGQCGANCTQAINFFLGRHVESGAMQACGLSPLGIAETDGTGSLLLNLLQVNARTLIRRCVVSGSNGARTPEPSHGGPVDPELAPRFLFSANVASGAIVTSTSAESGRGQLQSSSQQVGITSNDERGCEDPRLYMTEIGCRELNWQALAQEMLQEWDGFQIQQQQRPRRTTIDSIAYGERKLFDTMLQPYFNYRTANQVKAQLLKERNRLRSAHVASSYRVAGAEKDMKRSAHYRDLYLDGKVARGLYRYEGLDEAYSAVIARGASSSGALAADAAFEAPWERIPIGSATRAFTSADKTSFTSAFNATRELHSRFLAGIAEPPPVSEVDDHSRRTMHGSDLQDEVFRDIMPLLIAAPPQHQFVGPGVVPPETMSVVDRDAMVDYMKLQGVLFRPEHVQKSLGYLLAAPFATKAPAVLWSLRRERKALMADRGAALVNELKSGLVDALPTTHFAKRESQTEAMRSTEIVNSMILHQLGQGQPVSILTVELIEFLRENWCDLGAPWVSTTYAYGSGHFKGTDKAKILLEFIRLQSRLTAGATSVLETVSHPGPLLGGSINGQNQNETTTVVRYDHAAHHLREDLFPDADRFDYTRENLDRVLTLGMFEKDIGERGPHLFSGGTAASSPEDLELTDLPRVSQSKQEREVRLQRRCLGRNFALRTLLRTVDRFLPTDPTEGGICVPGNPTFVHDGIELMRHLVPVGSGGSTYFLETFVHGEAAQKHSYGKNEFWTHFDYAKSDIEVDGSLFLFLNGNFPHPPQAWVKVVKYLHEARPGATSVLVNLPGYGKDATRLADAGGSDCGIIGIASDILRDLIVSIKRSNTETWPRIFLVGDASPIGSGLAWATADKLDEYPADYLSGLVGFAPHPELALKPMLAMADPQQIPFYSLLSPIIGEMALGLNDFGELRKQVQDGTSFNSDHLFDDGTPLLREYTKFWKSTGIRSLTCYYRHNFHVNKGRMEATDKWLTKLHPRHAHVLLLRGERDTSYRREQWMGTFTLLPRRDGRSMFYHIVSDARTSDLLFKDEYAEEVGGELSRFAWAARMTDTDYLPSVHRVSVLPPLPSGGLLHDVGHDISLSFTIVAAGLAVLGGLFMERKLGAMLIKLESREIYWRFGQVAMVPICLACMASAAWLGLPLFFASLFKFGFPEVTTLLFAPWLLRGQEHWVDVSARFVDGIGFLLHHTGSSVIYGAVLGRLVNPLMLTCAIPLALQHAVSPLKYGVVSKILYGPALVLLEIWFQCEFFFILPYIRHWVPLLGLYLLVAAHWLWLARQILWIPLHKLLRREATHFPGVAVGIGNLIGHQCKTEEEFEVAEELVDPVTGKKMRVSTTSKVASRRGSVFMDDDVQLDEGKKSTNQGASAGAKSNSQKLSARSATSVIAKQGIPDDFFDDISMGEIQQNLPVLLNIEDNMGGGDAKKKDVEEKGGVAASRV